MAPTNSTILVPALKTYRKYSVRFSITRTMRASVRGVLYLHDLLALEHQQYARGHGNVQHHPHDGSRSPFRGVVVGAFLAASRWMPLRDRRVFRVRTPSLSRALARRVV